MTILKNEQTDTDLKALNGARVVLLDTDEVELLHLNSNVTLIRENKIVQLQFGGLSPIVGTDWYVVGTCQAWGDWNTMLASKADILLAQQSTGSPLIQMRSSMYDGGFGEDTPSTLEVKAGVMAVSVDGEPVPETPKKPTPGAFSGYIL